MKKTKSKKKNDLTSINGIFSELLTIAKEKKTDRYSRIVDLLKEDRSVNPKKWKLVIKPDLECQGFTSRAELLDYIDRGINTKRFEKNLKARGYKHTTVDVSFTYNVRTTVPARNAEEASYRAAAVTHPGGVDEELLGRPEVKTTVIGVNTHQPCYMNETKKQP